MPLIDDNGKVVTPPKTVEASGGFLQNKLTGSDSRNAASYINQAADPRLNLILSKMKSPLSTGIISQTSDAKQNDQKFPYACRFHFNPTQIDVGYNVDEAAIPPSEQTPDQQKGVAVVGGQTSISFQLLFDRTFETSYPPRSGARDLRNHGVYEDIGALERVTGVRYDFVDPVIDAATKKVIAKGPIIGNMVQKPVYLIFGGGDGVGPLRPAAGLGFIVSITSMSVTYSHFTSRMVPVRAGVTINAVQYLGLDFDKYQRNYTLKQTL